MPPIRRSPASSCSRASSAFRPIRAQIHHDRGKGDDPYTLEDLSRIAKKLGLIGRIRRCEADQLHKLPLPAIAELATATPRSCSRSRRTARSTRASSSSSATASGRKSGAMAEFRERFARPAAADDRARADGRSEPRPFDISWFIPALVKYRKPLRDVLIASFFLQLMGLVSPIFFQLVIDKVLVHQSMTTLDVLAIGLASILIWETVLSGLRNWLFAHTTNRVDAELERRACSGISLNLPLSYFEARRVGDSVARVRELESIREFLTSNAVTVVIDLFFTIVFFAVMYLYSAAADADRAALDPDLRR